MNDLNGLTYMDIKPLVSDKPVFGKPVLNKPGSAGPDIDSRRADKAEAGGAGNKTGTTVVGQQPLTRQPVVRQPVVRQPEVRQPPVQQPPEVEVSEQAKAIGSALANVATQPDMDSSRVAKIRAAIGEGRYSVSAERLADNMLRFEEILSLQKRKEHF